MDGPVGRRGSALASCVDGLGVREPILEETRRFDGRSWLAALRPRLARAAWIWRCQRGCKRKDREQPASEERNEDPFHAFASFCLHSVDTRSYARRCPPDLLNEPGRAAAANEGSRLAAAQSRYHGPKQLARERWPLSRAVGTAGPWGDRAITGAV